MLRGIIDISGEENKMFVTEYCSNGSLYDWAKKPDFKKLSDDEKGEIVMRLLTQLTIAVEMLHKGFLSHRDIKPQNVFVTGNLDFILGDYGMCGEPGIKVGTKAYFAPEQVLAKKNHTIDFDEQKSIDLFGIGLTAYWLAVGAPGPVKFKKL